MKFLYCTTITKGLLLLLAALVCECGYGQVLIGSAPVVWEAGREYVTVCAAERCLDVSLSLSLCLNICYKPSKAAAGAKRIIGIIIVALTVIKDEWERGGKVEGRAFSYSFAFGLIGNVSAMVTRN